MRSRHPLALLGITVISGFPALLAQTPTAPSAVKVVKKGAGFQILRNGRPYFI